MDVEAPSCQCTSGRSVWLRVEAGHADEIRWEAGHDGLGRDVLGDDGAGAHDGSVTDGNARDDGDGGSEPYLAARTKQSSKWCRGF